MANLTNLEIRQAINRRRLKHYEVATMLGITQYTFSHWLQTEMPDEKKQKVLKAIQDYKY